MTTSINSGFLFDFSYIVTVHSSAEGAVLWLFRTHNRVNKRLSGDLTEDPQRPKIQFPAPAICEKCWSTQKGMWVSHAYWYQCSYNIQAT